MARVALLVLVVAAMAFTGEVIAQSTCLTSIGFCTIGSYFTQGSTCVNSTDAPVSINFTTLGALLAGANGTTLGLSATLATSISTALSGIGGALTGGALTGGATLSIVPLGTLLLG